METFTTIYRLEIKTSIMESIEIIKEKMEKGLTYKGSLKRKIDKMEEDLSVFPRPNNLIVKLE